MSRNIYYVQSFRYPEDGDDEGVTTFESAHGSHESATARLLPLLRQICSREYAAFAELHESEFLICQNGFTLCEVCVVETELIDGMVFPRSAEKEKSKKKPRMLKDREKKKAGDGVDQG
jgi:hypothetical protein